MAIVSIGDLLDRAGEFEARVEKYYTNLRDETEDNGVRLLTYYLSKHRRHQARAIEGFTAHEVEQIRQIKLMFDIEFHAGKEFHVIDTPPQEVKGETLLDAAVEYDMALVVLYKKILEQPLSPQATLLFDSLIGLEEQDIIMLKKMLAMHYF